MSTDFFGNRFNILLVDDDKYVLLILNKILQKAGFYVSAVETGNETMKQLETQKFDAAIIDVRLQDMSGLDLLDKVQKVAPDMTKIILTGYPSDEDRIRALGHGASYYLSKPIPSEKLVQIVHNTRIQTSFNHVAP